MKKPRKYFDYVPFISLLSAIIIELPIYYYADIINVNVIQVHWSIIMLIKGFLAFLGYVIITKFIYYISDIIEIRKRFKGEQRFIHRHFLETKKHYQKRADKTLLERNA